MDGQGQGSRRAGGTGNTAVAILGKYSLPYGPSSAAAFHTRGLGSLTMSLIQLTHSDQGVFHVPGPQCPPPEALRDLIKMREIWA